MRSVSRHKSRWGNTNQFLVVAFREILGSLISIVGWRVILHISSIVSALVVKFFSCFCMIVTKGVSLYIMSGTIYWLYVGGGCVVYYEL